MSQNARGYRKGPGNDYDYPKGRNHRYPRSSRRPRSRIGGGKERDFNHRRDYNKFPKFKDNRSEEKEDLDIMTNSYEQNSPGIKGGYSHRETSHSKENERSTAPIRRKRKDEKPQIGKEENADTHEFKNSDKNEGNHNIQLNVYANTRKRFRSQSSDSDVEKLKAHVKMLVNGEMHENPKNETKVMQPRLKDNNQINAASSSSSSDSSSEEENPDHPKQLKKENVSEDEEVVCLGAIEQVENLIEKSSDNGIDESCILCEKEGHTSFYCFMVCKNCGEKYHSLRNCPKPANISTVLQRLMEFNLSQCRQYNPEEKFDFSSPVHIASGEIQDAFKKYFESNTMGNSSPGQSKSSKKRRSSSTDSQCSSSGNTSKKRKHRNRESKTNMNNSFNPFSFNCGFTPSFPFGTPGMPFGAQGVNINTILALAQIMGQFPFNSANNRT